jgi:carbon-monoxide dehydrogenase large subunit
MNALRFSAVVLAAGTSTRMGAMHKLLLPLGDEPVIRRTARAVLGAHPAEVDRRVGESATVGAPPAIANAVVDALRHLGVTHIDLPITPEKVWRVLKAKGAAL